MPKVYPYKGKGKRPWKVRIQVGRGSKVRSFKSRKAAVNSLPYHKRP